MKDPRRSVPSPSLVISVIALFVALSAGAVALPGGDTVRSDDIVRGQVRRSDIAKNAVNGARVASNSLGSNDLRDGSVGSADVALDSLGSDDLAPNAIGSSELGDGSVGSADVGLNSLQADDLAAGSVGSSEVIDNSLTSGDIDESTLDLKLRRVVTQTAFNSASPKELTLACPPGTQLISAFHNSGGGLTGTPPDQVQNVVWQGVIIQGGPNDPPNGTVFASAAEAPGGYAGDWAIALLLICAEISG